MLAPPEGPKGSTPKTTPQSLCYPQGFGKNATLNPNAFATLTAFVPQKQHPKAFATLKALVPQRGPPKKIYPKSFGTRKWRRCYPKGFGTLKRTTKKTFAAALASPKGFGLPKKPPKTNFATLKLSYPKNNTPKPSTNSTPNSHRPFWTLSKTRRSTGKLLWDTQQDTRWDPLDTRRDAWRDPLAYSRILSAIFGGIHWLLDDWRGPLWRDAPALAGCWAGSAGEIHSGGMLGGIRWRAAVAGYWAGAWCRSIANGPKAPQALFRPRRHLFTSMRRACLHAAMLNVYGHMRVPSRRPKRGNMAVSAQAALFQAAARKLLSAVARKWLDICLQAVLCTLLCASFSPQDSRRLCLCARCSA